jgi:hypothetical protein
MSTRTLAVLGLVAALAVALLGGGCVPKASNPQKSPNETPSGELVEAPKEWDGKTVTFAGEAIGEAMVRDDQAWIHLNDDAYYLKNVEEGAALGGYNSGMAIWLPTGEAEKITSFGDYKHEGDVVSVEGVFNAACGEHGGDMDIHATRLEIVAKGRHAADPVRLPKLMLAVGLIVLAIALFVANRKWDEWAVGSRSAR